MSELQLRAKYLKKSFRAFWKQRADVKTRRDLRRVLGLIRHTQLLIYIREDVKSIIANPYHDRAPRRPNFRLLF